MTGPDPTDVPSQQIADKPGLTAKRPPRKRKRRPKTDEEMAVVIAQLVRSLGRRLADRDAEELALLTDIERATAAAKVDAITGVRAHSGATWADIGEATGMTRQAAREYWTKRGVR